MAVARLRHSGGVIVGVPDGKVGRLLGAGFTLLEGGAPGPVADGYDAMTVADLKAEIDARNEGRDEVDQVSATGNKAELIAALESDDE